MSFSPVSPGVAIAFHSGYGHTAVLAEAVARGVVSAGADVVSVAVDAITVEQWALLDTADASIFFFAGAAAQTPADAGPEAVHESDIATAEHLGARIAREAAVFAAGRAALAAAAA